jgi:hypothetical protein
VRFIILMVCASPFFGCSGANVTISTDEPVNAVLQPLGNFDAEVTSLGTLPVTLPASELTGKMVRVEAGDGRLYYWMFLPNGGGPMDIKFKAKKTPISVSAPAPDLKESSADLTNRMMRMTLEAYDALGRQEPEVALKLAQELAAQQPNLAAPRIIEGWANLQQGDREGARAALTVARALDPQDDKVVGMLEDL